MEKVKFVKGKSKRKVTLDDLYDKIVDAVARETRKSRHDAETIVFENEAYLQDMIEFGGYTDPYYLADIITTEDEGIYAWGGVTKNSQVIQHFLTDNKEVGTKNLSTHYDSDTGVVRLKNYATIIAERDGDNVRVSTKKYSVTTSKIQNEVRREAKSMGMNVIDREMFMKGGIAGDVYSIENPEQFKQLITVYNELTEKFQDLVYGYYLDHSDKSIVFLTTPNISDIGKDKIFLYVESLKSKGYTIFDWQKTLSLGGLDWGTEKGSMVKERLSLSNKKSNPQWFKMYLKGTVKYSDGGMVYGDGGELSIGTEIVGSKKVYFVYNAKSGKKSSYYGSEMEAKNQLNKMKNNLVDRKRFMKGGIAGDVYSIENPEQFKQLITVYNELTEKFEDLVNGYYLDHSDKSIVFLTTPNISDIGKDKIFLYVESLKSKGYTIFDWQKTLSSGGLDWGTEKGAMVKERLSLSNKKSNPQWFKMYLKGTVKYSDGGMVYGDGGTAEEQNKQMILSQAKEVAHHVEELQTVLSKDPNIDSWVVAKMQDVSTGLSDITHYLDGKSEYAEGGEIILGGGSMASVQDSIMARGAKLKSKDYDFSYDTDQWYDTIVYESQYADKKDLSKLIEITDRGASKSNLEALSNFIRKCEFIPPPAMYFMDVQIRKIMSDAYKDEFRFQYGGNRIGAGKKSATSEFFSMVYQAITYHETAANGAKLKSGKLTLDKLKSMIEKYNSEGRNFELSGAYNQLELWSNDHRLEAGSKEDIYRALIRYRYNPKYADGAELPEEIDLDNMTDEEIINFANTLSYYDRMDEGIEEEFTDVEDAKEYILLIEEGE